MIRDVRCFYQSLDKKTYEAVAFNFSISTKTASKYIKMSEEEVQALDNPIVYKKMETVMDEYLHMIYKMLFDGIAPETIFSYILSKGYSGNWNTLEGYISTLACNNFNKRYQMGFQYKYKYPDGVLVIKRMEIIIYITSKKALDEKYSVLIKYIDVIKSKYPIIEELKLLYNEFHAILMGDDPSLLDGYIQENEQNPIKPIKSFINGLKSDIESVKNAIYYEESSGFVEGNNNKFKLIKRILYGRANLDNLFKKVFFTFKINDPNFNVKEIIKMAYP